MPLLPFKKQFSELILSGKKSMTIRARRKRPIKVGDLLHLFTGLRTANCVKLGTAQCAAISGIRIEQEIVQVNGEVIGGDALNELATSDGFKDWNEMKTFFSKVHTLPFQGQLITWKEFKRHVAQ